MSLFETLCSHAVMLVCGVIFTMRLTGVVILINVELEICVHLIDLKLSG